MARPLRIVLPGWVHHVTQRGNHRQNIFFEAHDRFVYLALLSNYLARHRITLIGYCLMDNHVHLAVIPLRVPSLALCIGQMHHDFARWQNIQRNRSGHLWECRYYSCPVEGDRVSSVLSYIDLNPVRAGIAANAWDWEWSSARAHVTGNDPTGLLDMDFWRKQYVEDEWKKYLEKQPIDKATVSQIRSVTSTGRLLGSEVTARRLEIELGRSLLPGRRGRPPAANRGK